MRKRYSVPMEKKDNLAMEDFTLIREKAEVK